MLERCRDKIATSCDYYKNGSLNRIGFRRSRIRAEKCKSHRRCRRCFDVKIFHPVFRKAVSRSLTRVSRSLYRQHVILLKTACNRTFATRST